MGNSKLAQRLEEFQAIEAEARAAARAESRRFAVATHDTTRRARRRLTLTTRNLLLRDTGPRQFRVF